MSSKPQAKPRLVQFHPAFGLPNASPFCLKLEAWMRMVGIEYEVESENDPRKAPKGKLPVLVDGEEVVADSTLIIQYLKERFGTDPDAELSPRQRAESVAYQRLCDDHLYWVLVYSRWVDEGGWAIMKKAFSRLPPPLRWVVPLFARRNVRGQLHAQGLGRHDPREIYRFGIADLNALAARLEKPCFFHGDAPSTIDTVVFSTVANVLWTPIENEMVRHARELPALHDYCVRVWEGCFVGEDLPRYAGA